MRPKSIALFELLNMAVLALGVFQGWLASGELMQTGSVAFIIFVQLGTFAILVGLVLLVSRKRSKIAMWIFILMTLLGLPMIFEMLSNDTSLGSSWITIVQTIVQLIAIALLFLPSSRKWMENREEIDLTKTFS